MQVGKVNTLRKPLHKLVSPKAAAESSGGKSYEELWGEEGIEHQAGKGWGSMTTEQDLSENALIKAAVEIMFAPPMVGTCVQHRIQKVRSCTFPYAL